MTDSLKGRRLGAVIYAPRGVAEDYMPIVDADGRIAWILVGALPVARPVTEDDGAGGFEIVFDDDGEVIYDG